MRTYIHVMQSQHPVFRLSVRPSARPSVSARTYIGLLEYVHKLQIYVDHY